MPTISLCRTDLVATRTVEAEVIGLGAAGDGVLRVDGVQLFVPAVLPGERVRLHPEGRGAVLDAVLQPSPERVRPPCRLFPRCGGCTLQHMHPDAIASFKRDLVFEALARAGFAPPAEIGLSVSPPASRRRMDLALRRLPSRLLVGLHHRGGDVVDLTECHVLEPRLFALIEAMRPVLLRLGCLRATGSAIVNLLDSGPDLVLATEAPPDAGDRTRLAALARDAGIPRIAWRPSRRDDAGTEVVCALSPVHHGFGGVRISPPPGAFLQATWEGERAIVAAVLAGLPASMPRSARIIELYAGCGTLSFAMAERARMLAVEGDKEAASCLRAGIRPGTRMQVEQRDLTRQPLLAASLAKAAVIVLDPPFAGAGPQMPEIAAAGVKRVILVNCNPHALAKDAAWLRGAGYTLERLSIVDQFVWSTGVESVAVFSRQDRQARPRQP